MSQRKAILKMMIAALLLLGAAICAVAQTGNPAVKQNTREQATKATTTPTTAPPREDVSYSYEFQKAEFLVRHILIKHDAEGRGEITFERQDGIEPIVEHFELSENARSRIKALWDALRFLDSNANYQSERQFPHLGTMRLGMIRGTQQRVAEFNWTSDPNVKALTDEYRRIANQAIFIFDISVSRENQPLNSPKLLDQLDRYIASNQLSDPQQLVPLIRELSTDERLPLMTRNHADRILKKLEK